MLLTWVRGVIGSFPSHPKTVKVKGPDVGERGLSWESFTKRRMEVKETGELCRRKKHNKNGPWHTSAFRRQEKKPLPISKTERNQGFIVDRFCLLVYFFQLLSAIRNPNADVVTRIGD